MKTINDKVHSNFWLVLYVGFNMLKLENQNEAHIDTHKLDTQHFLVSEILRNQ